MVTFNEPKDGARTASGMPVSDRGMTTPEETKSYAPSPLTVQPLPELGIGRVSWRAVSGGALLSLSLLIVSTALGRACGIPAFTGGEYGFGAGLWSIVSAALAFFCGAYLAVCLRGNRETFVGFLHGICVWSLAVPAAYLLFGGGIIGNSQIAIMGPRASDVVGAMNSMLGSPAATPIASSNPYMGPGWGMLISLLAGLVCAVLGGLIPGGSSVRNVARDLAREARPM